MTEYKMKYLIGIILAAFSITASAQTLEGKDRTGATVTLTQETGPCVNGAKLAYYVSADKQMKVSGCWTVPPGAEGISLAWFNGYIGGMPIQVFKPKETL